MTQTVGAAFAAWIAYRGKLVALDLVAQSTLDNQSQIVATLTREIGATALDQIRKSDIELFIGERLRTCAPVTVRGELNVLRQFFNWCVDETLLAVKPRMPTLKVPNTEDTLPSDAAFTWVLANVPDHHARALEFMMLTGLSPHELERVQVRDFAPAFGQLEKGYRLNIGMRPDFPVKQASRRRSLPLNGRARQIWMQESGGFTPCNHVFPNGEAIQKAIVRARRHDAPVGVESVTPKSMRSWFASKVAAEHPEHVLQKLMGHAPGSPITRRHYVRSNDDQVAAAVENIGA